MLKTSTRLAQRQELPLRQAGWTTLSGKWAWGTPTRSLTATMTHSGPAQQLLQHVVRMPAQQGHKQPPLPVARLMDLNPGVLWHLQQARQELAGR